ncbi:ACP S-malonyltransferase [Vagococcus elongatus]|uniref:Malonyl CoA-acyl carrier protein transacylase n=1 Tax=Vagococcus elongatus TaxID=180344 RepID=A0A430ART6_9ENTE|nr:ACP S-malonyltransferase [Vagococcus elongatus]RSU10765.1 [acyl-carrier-protein] S-malonyltransferase [Vagococcus elongatus]
MAIGFIYSGQGAQYHGMGKELSEAYPVYDQTLEEASDALGWDMKALSFNENSQLDETEFTQPAVLTMSTALHRVLAELGVTPDIVAGLSLGEYSALVASDALTFSETVQLVQKRGRWMTEAVPHGKGAMSAVMNIPREIVEEACLAASEYGVVIPANYNMPNQIVISGEVAAVAKAEQLLSGHNRSKIIRLNVSGPFHTSLLAPASEKLSAALAELTIRDMRIPVVTNLTGEIIPSKDEIAPTLVQQVKSPVYWEDCVRTMIAEGVDTFLELGPGRALKGFVKKIDRTVNVENIEDVKTLEKALASFNLS